MKVFSWIVLPYYYLVMQAHPKTSVCISLDRNASHDHAKAAGEFTSLARHIATSPETMVLFM